MIILAFLYAVAQLASSLKFIYYYCGSLFKPFVIAMINLNKFFKENIKAKRNIIISMQYKQTGKHLKYHVKVC